MGAVIKRLFKAVGLVAAVIGLFVDQRPDRPGLDRNGFKRCDHIVAVQIRFAEVQAVEPVVGPCIAHDGIAEGQNPQPAPAVQAVAVLVVAGNLGLDEALKLCQLRKPQTRLYVGHAVVVADFVVQKLQYVGLGLGAQVLGMVKPGGIVAHHHAARAGRDDLVAVETVTAQIPEAARKPPGQRPGRIVGAKSLGCVLNQNQAIAAGNLRKARHIGHIAEHMHDDQRRDFCARSIVVQPVGFQRAAVRAEILDRVGVEAERIIAADKNGFRPDIAGQRVDRRDEGQGGHNDLLPGAKAGRHRGQVQRRGAGVRGHGARHLHIRRKGLLKLRHAGAACRHPARGDCLGCAGKLLLSKIRNRKRDKTRHHTSPDLLLT